MDGYLIAYRYFRLAVYFQSKFDSKNDRRAFKYYMKALQAGYLQAYTRVGMCYQDTIGVEYDIDIAIDYYIKGMDAGDKSAFTMLACLFQTGEGIIQSNYIAYQLHRHANTAHSIWNMELIATYFPDVLYKPHLKLSTIYSLIIESTNLC